MSPKKIIANKKIDAPCRTQLHHRLGVNKTQRCVRELKRQNEILRRAQAEAQTILSQYIDLYDFAPMGYFTLNRDGTIIQSNLNGARLLGVERVALISQRFDFFVSKESQFIFISFLEKIFNDYGKHTCEIVLMKNEREPIWVRIKGACSKTLREQDQTCHVVVSDITESKHAKNILQVRLHITEFAAEHSLGELLQNALDELCVLTDSPMGFFHYVEPDQKTLWLQAWSTRTLKEMCTAKGQGRHYDIDQAGVWVDCVREKRPIIHNDYKSILHRRGLPQGHVPVVREMVFPIIRNQKIVAIIGVGNKALNYTQGDLAYASRLADLIWDIAERKRAESQREAALESLRESEARYRSILEDQTEMICRYLPDGRLSFVNEAYARYYGETAQKLINTNFCRTFPNPISK